MKEVKLVERKSTARLLSLIGEIPELILNNDFISARDGRPMYYLTTGKIWTMYNRGEINKNPLKNAYKLKLACDNGIRKITEESFCDLLEEHLYLVAKEKMEELLPQIQEHLPDSEIIDNNHGLSISDNFIDVVVYSRFKVLSCFAFDSIWEDKENLIVKKPKPWWEVQHDYYTCQALLPHLSEFTPVNHAIKDISRTQVGVYAGISTFKNKEEAQSMCDKLNAVLKGE